VSSKGTTTTEHAKESNSDTEQATKSVAANAVSVESHVQILYIQMEFCEKSTLRQAIDDGELFSDQKRAWRLFREICEGLNYIHKQVEFVKRDTRGQ